ncbi:hypothetical protein [Bradyrhizobium sp. LB13.1]
MTTDTDVVELICSGKRAAGATRDVAGSSRISSAVIKLRLAFKGLLTRVRLRIGNAIDRNLGRRK